MKKTIVGALLFLISLVPALSRADGTDYRDMGQALYQKGLYAKAVDYFRQAVAADANDWQSYQAMGDAYLKMDDKPEALDAYQKSLRINPDNADAQTKVDNLAAAGVRAPSNSVSNPAAGESRETQPVIKRRLRPTPVVYNDGLAAMDHAKVWTQFSLGYANSRNTELIGSANGWNSDIANNGWTGSATASSDGLELGFELGFLISPNNGLSLGVKYVNTNDYTLGVNFQNGPATVSGTVYDSDFDQTTLSPYIIPITLDYYLFLPDGGGRFWLSGGVGYYFGDVHVERSYSAVIQNNDPNQADQYSGDLTAGAPGFQLGIGRDFAISPNMSLTLFARGRYAKLTNFMGTITDVNGFSANVGLATEPYFNNEVYVEDQTQIGGAAGNKYTTIDFTGFDVGLALNFYSL